MASVNHTLTNQDDFDAKFVTIVEIADRAGVTRQSCLSWIGNTIPNPYAIAGRTMLWERATIEPILVALDERRRVQDVLRSLVAA